MSRLPTLLPKLYEKENYLYKKYYDDEQYLNNLNNNYYQIMRWNNNAF